VHTPKPPDEFDDFSPEGESLEAQFNPITSGDAPVFSSEDEFLAMHSLISIEPIFNPVTMGLVEPDEE
jgi:hypothetical protein